MQLKPTLTLATLFCLLSPAWSQDEEVHWLAHLSANEQFNSRIVVRNDHPEESAHILVAFFASDGLPAQVTFSDETGQSMTATSVDWQISPLHARSLAIQSVNGGDNRSIQARLIAQGGLSAVEASFDRFDGGEKTAVVGVPVAQTGRSFRINVDPPIDPDSGLARLRGLGIANTDELRDCECLISLVDESGNFLDTSLVRIVPRGKWLGIASDLFPDVDLIGSGYLDALCGEQVAVLALSFEGFIMSTVPITVFQLP